MDHRERLPKFELHINKLCINTRLNLSVSVSSSLKGIFKTIHKMLMMDRWGHPCEMLNI